MESLRKLYYRVRSWFRREPAPDLTPILKEFDVEQGLDWRTLLDREGQISWEEIRETDQAIENANFKEN